MRWWIPLAALGGLVVAVIIGGVIFLSVQDVSAYKETIAERVSEETGRELTIAGDFDLSISFSPAIVAEDVTFANAPWGSTPEMLKLRRMEAEVALFPMLGGRVEIKRLVLVDADITLETDKNGVGNWKFEEPEKSERPVGSDTDSGAGQAGERAADPIPDDEESDEGLPIIEHVRIENARLVYRDGQTGEERVVHIDRANGRLPAPGEPVDLEVDGSLDGLPLSATATIGTGKRDVPAKLAAEIAGADITAEGTIGDPETLSGLSFSVRAKGDNLADLNALGVSTLPDLGPYEVTANLRDEQNAYHLDDLAARLDDMEITGKLRMEESPRPRLDADLAATRLDLDRFLAAEDAEGTPTSGTNSGGTAKQQSEQATTSGAAADGARERLFSDEPIDLTGLSEADARINLKAGEILYGGSSITDFALTLILDGGVLSIRPMQGKFAGGDLSFELALDSVAKPPALNTQISLTGADLAGLKSVFDVTEIASGPTDLSLDITGRGSSAHQIAASANGRLDFVIGEGRIHNEYIDLLAADLLRQVMPGMGDEDVAQLNCFVARFNVVDGIATSDGLLLDTGLTTTAGKGQVNLGQETTEITVVPRPKDPSLLSLALPVVVHGPFDDLSYDIKKEDAIMSVATIALGTAVLGPFGVLVPLVSAGTADENPCITALSQTAEDAFDPSKPAPQPGSSEPDPAAIVDDAVDKLRKLFD